MARGRLSPVGQWLGQSFSGLKTRLLPLSIIFVVGFVGVMAGMLLVYVIGAVLFGFIQGWGLVVATVTNPQRLQAFVAQNQLVILVFELLATLVGLRIYCWATLAAIHAASFDSTGVRAAFRAGKGRGYGFLGLFIVVQVLIGIGAVFFLLPGLIVAVFLGFSLWVYALENAGVFASLGISARLVKGRFLGVLGRMLLVGLIASVIMVIPIIGWLVGAALLMVAWSKLYIELSDFEPARQALADDSTEPAEVSVSEPEELPEPEAVPLPAVASSSRRDRTSTGTRGPIAAIVLGLILLLGSVAVTMFG